MKYSVEIKDLVKKRIHSIDLLFEDFDIITIFRREIVDMEIECEPVLVDSGNGYVRVIKGGYIKLNIQKECSNKRKPSVVDTIRTKNQIIKRLFYISNITWLDVEYRKYGERERFEVPYEEVEDEETGEIIGLSKCSSCKIDEDGNLIILMGDRSEFVPYGD